MANTFTALHYHLVFSTKNREPWIGHDIESRVWSFVAGIAQQNDIRPIQIGGMPDHLHLVLGIPARISVSEAAQLIKGGSSKWIKTAFPGMRGFGWQDGYGAFTVSKSVLPEVVSYVQDQREHPANPALESAGQNLTAAAAQTILDDIIVKENNVTAQRTVVGNAVKAKNSSLRSAIRALSGLVAEMKGLVGATDVVYLAFGLKIPGAQAIPSVPTNLIATLLNAAALLKWDASERAERYRIYKKVIGVDLDFVLVGSREELDYLIEGLPANATVQLAVSAMNNGGESALSKAVTIMIA